MSIQGNALSSLYSRFTSPQAGGKDEHELRADSKTSELRIKTSPSLVTSLKARRAHIANAQTLIKEKLKKDVGAVVGDEWIAGLDTRVDGIWKKHVTSADTRMTLRIVKALRDEVMTLAKEWNAELEEEGDLNVQIHRNARSLGAGNVSHVQLTGRAPESKNSPPPSLDTGARPSRMLPTSHLSSSAPSGAAASTTLQVNSGNYGVTESDIPPSAVPCFVALRRTHCHEREASGKITQAEAANLAQRIKELVLYAHGKEPANFANGAVPEKVARAARNLVLDDKLLVPRAYDSQVVIPEAKLRRTGAKD